MRRVSDVIKERITLTKELASKRETFQKEEKELVDKISKLKRLENIGATGLDLDKVELAEKILSIQGNPYGHKIIHLAIDDIATGCNHLKNKYFGNKRYEGFYQRQDCEYGYGPKHGAIVDKIALKSSYQRDLTPDEQDACIYYLQNFVSILEAKQKKEKS